MNEALNNVGIILPASAQVAIELEKQDQAKELLSKTVIHTREDGSIDGYIGGVEIRDLILAGNFITAASHLSAVQGGWWNDLHTGEDMRGKRNVPELLCLIHSEISEAMEAHRKGKMDDKLPHRSGLEVELADAVIRIFDLAGGFDLDLGSAIAEKLAFNAKRADHKRENRMAEGGKAY